MAAIMRRMSSGIVVVLVAALVVAASAQNTIYSCWGGCYNECFMGTIQNTRPEMLSCYYPCLNNCVPRSAADYQYYCQIGCSIQQCIPAGLGDGATLENCYGRCTNLCRT